MNKLKGTIKQIKTSGSIMLVDIDVDGHSFSALLIESSKPPEWLQIGNPVIVAFKESEVIIAKIIEGQISTRNKIPCTIDGIERGELLSKISLQFNGLQIVSAITSRAVDSLHLLVGDKVEALIKSNEVSLIKVQ